MSRRFSDAIDSLARRSFSVARAASRRSVMNRRCWSSWSSVILLDTYSRMALSSSTWTFWRSRSAPAIWSATPDQARERGFHPKTMGGDKNYDTRGCVDAMRERGVTPHVAQTVNSAIDGRTTRQAGYAVSQRVRKRVEEIFGWMKTVGGFRHTRYRGVERTGLAGYLMATTYNLVRMAKLLPIEQEEAAVVRAA